MKRAIIVHCWSGTPEMHWYQNTKKELEDNGFQVSVPAMPDTDLPKFDKWLSKLQEVAGESDEDLYLIGHSLGCITILRFLENLKHNQKVGGVVMVAGFTDDLEEINGIEEELKSFFETPILWDEIRTKADKFVAIHSDNDPYVKVEYGKIFKEKLGAKIIIKHNMGHFSSKDDGGVAVTSLEDVTPEILKMTSEI